MVNQSNLISLLSWNPIFFTFEQVRITTMSFNLLQSGIQYLKGVGPKRAEMLQKELGINSFRDLLYTFPFKYIDRSRFFRISEIDADASYVQIKGKIIGRYNIPPEAKIRIKAILDYIDKPYFWAEHGNIFIIELTNKDILHPWI